MSKRLIQGLLDEAFGLTISIGQICRLQAKMADALDPCVEEALGYIPAIPALNATESGCHRVVNE